MEDEIIDEELEDTDEDEISELSEKIKRVARKKDPEIEEELLDTDRAKNKSTWDKTISTGSTWLDLAISGMRTRGGGIPGGFVFEIFSDSSLGKTTIACKAAANAQSNGGEIVIDDPENRLTPEYRDEMGVIVSPENYKTSETVDDVFDFLVGPLVEKKRTVKRLTENAWTPNPSNINIVVEDSLTSLTTRMEQEKGDKMGQRRAKEFSQGFRIAKGHFRKYNITAICTNQIRDNVDSRFGGVVTPGGHAVKFYSSCRIKLNLVEELKKTIEVRGREHEQTYGIRVRAKIIKNSLDNPYRTADFFIIYNYGIDDTRANLQFLKENGGFDTQDEKGKWKASATYRIGDRKIRSLEDAIKFVEDSNLEEDIRNQTIDLWEEIQEAFKTERKSKRKNEEINEVTTA